MTAPSAALRNAIGEAEFLLKFVAERKGTPAPDIVDAIEAARTGAESGTIDGKQESNFWTAYNKLSRQAAPVTVESLRFVHDFKDRKTPMARALRWLRRYTAVVFVVLMSLQIYWTTMSSLVSDVTRMNDEINAIVQNVRYGGEGKRQKARELRPRDPPRESAKSRLGRVRNHVLHLADLCRRALPVVARQRAAPC